MKVFSNWYLTDLMHAAKESPRLRAHSNIHHSSSDCCQKLFNAINTNSYIQPHRHFLDPKEECLIAVKGLFGLIIFNNRGSISNITLFGSEKYSEKNLLAYGVELPAGVWHTVVSLVDESILFEVKKGPFDEKLAKEMASWAPEEGSADVLKYLNILKQQVHEHITKLNFVNPFPVVSKDF